MEFINRTYGIYDEYELIGTIFNQCCLLVINLKLKMNYC